MSGKDLVRGFLLAHSAPKEIMDALEDINSSVTSYKPVLPDDILKWNLEVRTMNCLKNARVNTLEQLLTLSESELLKIPNFGRKSLNMLKAYMAPLRLPTHTLVKLIRDDTKNWHDADQYSYPNKTE